MSMFVRKRNLVVVDFGFGTGKVFDSLFEEVEIYKRPAQISNKSVVIFEGGNDISTELYGEKRGSWTQTPNIRRDDYEVSIYNIAKYRGAAFIGICRGAQLLTALNGGKLFQDVGSHANGNHWIKTDTGKEMSATSIHHQMMNPFVLPEDEYKVVAWSNSPRGALSTYYLDENDDQAPPPEKEPEVVWYPKTKSLCIQGHPEYAAINGPYFQYCQALVRRFITLEK